MRYDSNISIKLILGERPLHNRSFLFWVPLSLIIAIRCCWAPVKFIEPRINILFIFTYFLVPFAAPKLAYNRWMRNLHFRWWCGCADLLHHQFRGRAITAITTINQHWWHSQICSAHCWTQWAHIFTYSYTFPFAFFV